MFCGNDVHYVLSPGQRDGSLASDGIVSREPLNALHPDRELMSSGCTAKSRSAAGGAILVGTSAASCLHEVEWSREDWTIPESMVTGQAVRF